jgi:hypothetical protein
MLSIGLACAVALGAASRLPFPVERGDAAALRISGRVAGRPIEDCRTPSPEELARLPVHMRRSQICERRLSAFRLVVSIDGVRALEERIEPEGFQRDRPGYVLRELPLEPGRHQLAARLDSELPHEAAGTLEAELRLAPREVAVLRLDGAQLSLRRAGPPGLK